MRPHLFAGLLASLATRTYSLDTSTPECATICSRELMHYHGIPTVEGLCHDMVVQRELFSCLASSCTEQYGQALTYTISTCSSHGGTISDLLPVEIQHTSLATRHFMPLVSRSDSASFGFESRFSLSVDCKAGSDGVLTLSLPESTASVHQSIPDGGSPASPGAGNGNLNAGAGPPGGAPGPNNGPLPGNTASSGDGQGSPSGGTGPGGGGGNDGTEPSDPNADCEENNSNNGPSQSGNNDGQYQPAPAPAPAPTPANSNPQPDGQANGPPAPGPDAADGNSSPDNPHQGNPGQSQPQPAPAPAPAPSSPDGGDGAPNQDGTGGPGEDCDENAPPGISYLLDLQHHSLQHLNRQRQRRILPLLKVPLPPVVLKPAYQTALPLTNLPTNGPSMYSSPSQLKERAMADIEQRQENGQELDTPGNDISVLPAAASAASVAQADLPTESGMPEPSFVVSNDSTRAHGYSRTSLTFAALVVFVATFFMATDMML
ncbi:hypothetical protein FOC1_g10008395 [Fusarium oxysporum f. sp. cubense race 1]|uniref:Extracellular membrane protein CFEM domain-containing protein n=1 Tax=Fusarium oxysporum f. sp. cubense (strain race 1) TaxID=1229664 RepID=N4U7A8_FUSC1|nr:hypothetical protein FOC1_g10008395 [Fusarium oxysporum f. sp. cubense race 1]